MTILENYEQWLKDFAGDAETVAELESIRNDEKEIEDRFYTELSFGTAGMRGVLGAGMNRMNKYNVRRATKGLAGFLKETKESCWRREAPYMLLDAGKIFEEEWIPLLSESRVI